MQKTDTEIVKVGILTCHPTTGHVRPAWAPVIAPRDNGPRRTDMVMSHVWDGELEQAEAFAAEYGATAVANHWDMVDAVDGVILGDHNQIFDFEHLTRPYLEAGVPVFVNRPFAFSVADAREIVELAARHGTPLMCGSSFEYVKEVGVIRRQLAEAGPIRGYMADNAAGEYAFHGIHGLWMAYACVGGGVRRVAHLGADRRDPNAVGALMLEHEGRNGGAPFVGCIQPTGRQAWFRVYAEREVCEQTLQPEESAWDRDTFLWLPMLLKIQDLFQHLRMPESYDQILEKVKIFLAGFKSHVACGGGPVGVDEIGDWVAPAAVLQPRFTVTPAPGH